MNDAKLFELAVQLVAAEISSGFISQTTRGRDDYIDERITQHHDRLRAQWRERHQVANIEPYPRPDL